MTIDTSREAVERLAAEYRERVRMHDELTGACADLRRERTKDIRDLHEATTDTLTALLARAEAAEAEVARLSTPPDDAEVLAIIKDVTFEAVNSEIDRVLAGRICQKLARLSHAHASERKLADDLKAELVLAETDVGEAEDKFHIASFYIKDEQAFQCVKDRVVWMAKAGRRIRDALRAHAARRKE